MIMLRPVPRMLLFLVLSFWLLKACKSDSLDVDVSGIDLQVELERFDQELFGLNQDSLEKAVDAMYRTYGDFFDVFNVHVISIGQASARRYPSCAPMLFPPMNP